MSARRERVYVLEKLEAMTAVCSVGLDRIALPGAAPILEVRSPGAGRQFVPFGGRIPAPLQSLGN
jgi:uncharacterized protein (UPF0210 family)